MPAIGLRQSSRALGTECAGTFPLPIGERERWRSTEERDDARKKHGSEAIRLAVVGHDINEWACAVPRW